MHRKVRCVSGTIQRAFHGSGRGRRRISDYRLPPPRSEYARARWGELSFCSGGVVFQRWAMAAGLVQFFMDAVEAFGDVLFNFFEFNQ